MSKVSGLSYVKTMRTSCDLVKNEKTVSNTRDNTTNTHNHCFSRTDFNADAPVALNLST